MRLQNGDIILSRYNDEEKNTSPGHWNHAAIWDKGDIIESLRFQGVVTMPYSKWIEDVDDMIICRYSYLRAGNDAGNEIRKLVGSRYRMISSIFRYITPRRMRLGYNCVGAVRQAYKIALNKDPGWKFPDDIYKDSRFLKVV